MKNALYTFLVFLICNVCFSQEKTEELIAKKEDTKPTMVFKFHPNPVEDELFVSYLRAFLDEEATPILGEIKGINLDDYKDSLLERFANPNIKDSVSRICAESSAKLPKFLIPTIHEN